MTSPTTWQGKNITIKSDIPLMSGVGSRETGLDSLFASKPVGPGFEPCLGQSAKLAGAPKPLCLSVCPSPEALFDSLMTGRVFKCMGGHNAWESSPISIAEVPWKLGETLRSTSCHDCSTQLLPAGTSPASAGMHASGNKWSRLMLDEQFGCQPRLALPCYQSHVSAGTQQRLLEQCRSLQELKHMTGGTL